MANSNLAPHLDDTCFRSKEVSWLSFNSRVLQEAQDESVPLLERVRFLGIYSSNLDEFFRVRVATLKRLIQLGPAYHRKLQIPDPQKTFKRVTAILSEETKAFNQTYDQVFASLQKEGIALINEQQIPKHQEAFLSEYFQKKVRPHLMPIMVKHNSRLQSLTDLPMYLAVELRKSHGRGKSAHALIEIPTSSLPRFVVLPSARGKTQVIFLDDVIRFGLKDLFVNLPYDQFEAYAIKFTRDAEMQLDDDVTESTYDKVSEALKARAKGSPVRINYDSSLPKNFLNLLLRKLRLSGADTLYPGARYHNRKDLIGFPSLGGLELQFSKVTSLEHKGIDRVDFFKSIRKKDQLLHFPYHSFHYFLDFLRNASVDPLVRTIRLTQYRVAKDSCVAKALMAAVRNGKQVEILVEPQARFDEEANIAWANVYQEAGIRVFLGIPGLKVHAKLCLVGRAEGGKTRYYTCIGTGNFNEKTSEIYTDHMLMTVNEDLARDVRKVFQYFKSSYKPPKFKHLLMAPFYLRDGVLDMIAFEKKKAEAGERAEIDIKLNNFSDPEVVKALRDAAEAGVKLRMIVRSMFSMVVTDDKDWDVKGISIVDRFLEHTRILRFHHGGEEKVFLSSADFLPRNFDSRVEVLCPILDKKVKASLMEYFEIQWQDNTKARVLDQKLKNAYAADVWKTGKKRLRAQEEMFRVLGK